MPRFFNESNPVVKQRVEMSEMSVELDQIRQAVKLLAEEGDKELNSLRDDITSIAADLDVLKESQVAQNALLDQIVTAQNKTAKICVILLITVGVLIVSNIASFIF